MERTPVTSPGVDIAAVFGPLDEAATAAVFTDLGRAEKELFALRDRLEAASSPTWTCDGVCLDTFPSGQASISGYVENDELCFWAEIEQLSSETWEVSARVYRHASEGSLTAADLPDRRCESPEDAAAAFSAAVDELAALANSRPPDTSSWPAT